jgi:hypothetical protein
VAPFQPGDQIAWRGHVRILGSPHAQLSFAIGMTVVHDTPDEVAVFRRPGHPFFHRNAEFGGPAEHRHRPIVRWREGWTDNTWKRWRVLILKRPEEWHSVSLFWLEGEDRLSFWYIDLTSPLRHSAVGYDFEENGLDVVLPADLSSWQLKDEDELDWAVENGVFTKAEGNEILAEAERAAERLIRERDRYERWRDWRPDPSWPIPALPQGWDRIE